ncbi:MAG TPA: adenine deaminase C-terminal domain-containing protein, partial [Candidatus Bathyarchaeia archaeon]|nr:adenine deaminase C-terminal domain-containing protein [Candidatus Bathyarchaeia archaeon]
ARIGAFGSTQSFHENDMIVIGSNEKDMAVVANQLTKSQGGMLAVKDGNILCKFDMTVGGLISKLPLEEATKQYSDIDSKIIDAGCKFKQPHLIPIFLPFLALPEVRILYNGIVDVKNRTYLKIFNQ